MPPVTPPRPFDTPIECLDVLEEALSTLTGQIDDHIVGHLHRLRDDYNLAGELAVYTDSPPPESPSVSLEAIGRLYLFTRYLQQTARTLGDQAGRILELVDGFSVLDDTPTDRFREMYVAWADETSRRYRRPAGGAPPSP